MPGRRGNCQHQGPCSCEMGNLYRFVEPIVMLALARRGKAHGYQIAQDAEDLAVTDAGVDVAAVYRTLRRLEANQLLDSSWDTTSPGPARREYSLTPQGWEHLEQWNILIKGLLSSLGSLSDGLDRVKKGP